MADTGVFRWILDVKDLWPSPSGDDGNARATTTWATGKETCDALDLLTPDERTKVLSFYRVNDAKLSLASRLLKHRAIADTCAVAWSEAVVSQDKNKKPCYKPLSAGAPSIEFNVSHHGTLVGLVGCSGNSTRLGVDVVQMNWDKDYPKVLRDGFEAWANIYEMVFSEREMNDIAGYVPPERLSLEDEIRTKLRHFYAHWCLKEAYIKMTGEALLAGWLQELEFRDVQVPQPRSHLGPGENGKGDWGQTCTDVQIWFRGQRVTHVKLEIQAFREDYMVATSCSDTAIRFCPFKELNLLDDAYP